MIQRYLVYKIISILLDSPNIILSWRVPNTVADGFNMCQPRWTLFCHVSNLSQISKNVGNHNLDIEIIWDYTQPSKTSILITNMPEYEGKNKEHIHSKVTSRNCRTILYRFFTISKLKGIANVWDFSSVLLYLSTSGLAKMSVGHNFKSYHKQSPIIHLVMSLLSLILNSTPVPLLWC